MTSRFISQMLSFDLLDKHEQQSYVLSVTAYMVAGGFHSLHEVLGPIAHCLQEESLIPGYISEPLLVRGERQTPNFNVFYALMESLDPEVAIIRQNAWKKLIDFVGDTYLSQPPYLLSYENISDIIKKEPIHASSQHQLTLSYLFPPTLSEDREVETTKASESRCTIL